MAEPTSAEIGVDWSTAEITLAGLHVQLVAPYKFTVPPRPAGAVQSNTSRESHGFYGPQDLLRGPFVVS